jgi:hypothetical protein
MALTPPALLHRASRRLSGVPLAVALTLSKEAVSNGTATLQFPAIAPDERGLIPAPHSLKQYLFN